MLCRCHDADVSEAAWLLADVERLVRMLPAAAASDEEGDVDDRTSLLARLEEVKESIDKLMGHKLRTWYFGKYKTEILKIVQKDPTLAYDLSDYWGKLSPNGRRTRRRRPRRRRVRETHCPRAQGGAGGPRGPALGTESRPPRPPPRDRRRRSRHRRRPRSLVDAHAPRSRGCSTSSHPTPLAPTRSPGRPGTLKRLPGPIFPRGRRSGDVRPPFLLQAHGA